MSRFWYFFVDHFRFTYLLLALVILLGFISVYLMPKESDPEVSIPVGVVTVVYPGASAVDVEELVTNVIEEEIDGLDELDKYSSTSSEGLSVISVQFDADADIDDRIRALKDAVDDSVRDLPDEVEKPFVKQVSVSDDPMMIISMTVNPARSAGAAVSAPRLKKMAEYFQEEVEKIDGVSEVKVTGVQDREIQVTVDQAKLIQYEVSLLEVVRAIQNHDAQLPIGTIEQRGSKYSVRLEAGLKDAGVIPNIPVTERGGQPVFVKDLAIVTDGLVSVSSLSRLSLAGAQAVPAVGLEIFKRDGGDILKTTAAVAEIVDRMEEDEASGVEFVISFDLGEFIRRDLGNLIFSGMQTILIVFFLLYFFLGRREALLAGLSIPITFLMTFIMLSFLGYTINFLTLFSLVLSLGILVDATIVIVEGLYMHINLGESRVEAVKKTIKEFHSPVTSGILTTVSAFVPMMFASGVMGQFIRTIPVTVIVVLISSLFVGLALIPVIGSRLIKKTLDIKEGERHYSKVGFIQKLGSWYEKKLSVLLHSKRQQKYLFLGLITLFVFSMSMPFIGLVDAVLFPPVDDERIFIDVEAPIGSVLEKTDLAVKEIEEKLYGDERIVSFVSYVGSAGGQLTGGHSRINSNSHIGRFIVNILPLDERDVDSSVIVEEFRQNFKSITSATVRVTQLGAGPPSGAPVEIRFVGEDLAELERLVFASEDLLESIDGVTEIDKSIKNTPFEFAFRVDRAQAAQVGLSPLEIAQYIRTALFGFDAASIKIDGDEVDVLVQLNLNPGSSDPHNTHQTSIQALELLNIPTAKGTVPLISLISTNIQSSADSINHRDGDRISRITAYLEPDFTTQGVLKEFEDREGELNMTDGYEIKFGGEQQNINESFYDMYKAMVIGIFLIFMILILQFNSFRQPFFILAALPFALIGVFPGLAITGQPLSFPAFIGIVALVGIVVNDAIILMDQINHNRKKGLERYEAVINGCLSRLQPVILTTITTVFGILPITLSEPIWGPLGFSIIFGLSFATVLTLVVVPVLYYRYAEEEISSFTRT